MRRGLPCEAGDMVEPASRGDELVAVYDPGGMVVGSAPRRRVRAENLWHGCGAVFLLSPDGDRAYVHRRTDTKDIFPGALDCFAGGVVDAGEDPADCARRELAEELGVVGVPLRPALVDSYDGPGLRVHTHLFEARWAGEVRHQPEEIESGWWMPLGELRRRSVDPGWPLVPDSRQLLREWFRRSAASGRGT
ncbi:NUDIX hydrolase [Actinoalloteichus spitiensis]|uniref:NUDIX hydrolase n=1 Tax=Actinoalloteichus spitiensis TaxID=252394 RepID=UPI001FE200CF|nr:NUDIX domain-containing protein [Actinoalloteichus spitiensis]